MFVTFIKQFKKFVRYNIFFYFKIKGKTSLFNKI